jgi:hypothetical protein
MSEDLEARLTALDVRFAEQEATIAAQQRTIAQLEAREPAATPGAGTAALDVEPAGGSLDRRRLFRFAGVATAGAVVATAAGMGAGSASAAAGQPIVMGSNNINDTDYPTSLRSNFNGFTSVSPTNGLEGGSSGNGAGVVATSTGGSALFLQTQHGPSPALGVRFPR